MAGERRSSSLYLSLLILLLALHGCGDDVDRDGALEAYDGGADSVADADAADTPDAGAEDASADADVRGNTDASTADGAVADTQADSDATSIDELTVTVPQANMEVLYSTIVAADAPDDAVRVEVREPDSGATCDAPAPWFECLLDLSEADSGPMTVELTAFADDATELASTTVDLTRRAIDAPCTGDPGQLTDCIVARAETSDSAGFDGVTYINADDSHARVRTGGMTDIDARVIDQPTQTVFDDVTLGLMNESRAYTSGGSCSLTRCYPSSRQRVAGLVYEQNGLYMVPEHRDVGKRDFYQWQAPFFLLSQGSSSSEKDEIRKGLQALGVMQTAARDAVVQNNATGPLLSYLIVRARQQTDAAYLTGDAHPTALTNTDSDERILTLAAALRDDELPPVARLSVDAVDATFPDDWTMTQALSNPHAIGYTPLTLPDQTPTGEFNIEIDLSDTLDPNDRDVFFVPVVLREAGSTVAVERLDESGMHWSVRGDFPEDADIMTGGEQRTVSRVTVGFFPHNGKWLGAPVMVSVGARPSDERSSNDNNLD
jgi:hypothetical protein